MIMLFLGPQEQGRHLPPEDLFPAFREIEESQRFYPTPAASQVILIPNYQYAIVGDLGVACSGR